eukprot:2599939-Pleurochrysis_carterae.AAC.1
MGESTGVTRKGICPSCRSEPMWKFMSTNSPCGGSSTSLRRAREKETARASRLDMRTRGGRAENVEADWPHARDKQAAMAVRSRGSVLCQRLRAHWRRRTRARVTCVPCMAAGTLLRWEWAGWTGPVGVGRWQ